MLDKDKIIVSSSQTSTDISNMYRRLAGSSYDSPGASRHVAVKPFRLRPSQFPICSINALHEMLRHATGETDTENWTASMFKNMGIAVHDTMHEWATRTHLDFWGNARCTKCGHVVKDTVVNWEMKCHKCSSKMKYEELEINYKDKLKGFIDCVVIGDDGLYMVDYKTTSVTGQKKARYKDHPLQYSLQLFTYAYWLNRLYGKKMKEKTGKKLTKVSLLFITRNNPKAHREFTWDAGDAIKMGKEITKTMWNSLKAAERSLKDDPKAAIKGRLCKDKKHYDKDIKPFFYDGCPLAFLCVNSKHKDFRVDIFQWLVAGYGRWWEGKPVSTYLGTSNSKKEDNKPILF